MEVFHTNEHRGTTIIIPATGENQWLGDGYYFWQDYEFAVEWAKKYLVSDIYSVNINIDFHKDEDVIDAVFNEQDYYGFVSRVEKFARLYYNKFKEKPTLVDFNNYIKDHKISLWEDIKAIRFQDLPNAKDNKTYLEVKDFSYKKRIQIVLFDKEKIIKSKFKQKIKQ